MRIPCLNPQLAKEAAGSWLSLTMREAASCPVQAPGFQEKLTNYFIPKGSNKRT